MFISRFVTYIRDSGGPVRFADLILRTRSVQGRDVLAYGASHGELDLDSLVSLASQQMGDRDARPPLIPDLDPDWLLQLARVVALQPSQDDGFEKAAALFELVRGAFSTHVFDEAASALYAQVLLKLGRTDRLRDSMRRLNVPEPYRWSIELDSMNPFTGAGGDVRHWLSVLNTIFTAEGLESVSLAGGASNSYGVSADQSSSTRPFDRLTAQASSHRDDVLVTVIMPAFKPDHSIVTAINSVMAQSWRNVELLIVDDASPAEYQDLLHEAAATDDRIRLVTAPSNGGTYRARNIGLNQARGEFVTFQDADDWSHPRRIERQVDELRAHEHALATRSWAVRAYPDLTFTFVGYPPNRENASSLLFRREAVMHKLGYFDEVRKSADMEFAARLKAVARGSLLSMAEAPPLAITQLRHNSLSRSDAVPGWTRWNRLAYRDAYSLWHSRIRQGTANARLAFEATTRPFPLPEHSWSINRDSVPKKHHDVLVLGDWRRSLGSQREVIADIMAMRGMGLEVAIAYAEAPVPLAQRRDFLAPAIQRLISDDDVDFVHVEQNHHVDLVLVCYPGSLQFLPRIEPGLTADRVAILSHLRANGETSGPADFCVSDVAANAERLFSRRPIWVPRDPQTRDFLAGQLGTSDVADIDLPHAFEPSAWRVRRRRPSSARPIIGRPSVDHCSHWPTSADDLLAVYPDDDRFDVRVHGGVDAAKAVLGTSHVPANWTSFGEDQLSRRSYLAQLDFFLHLPHARADSVSTTEVLEAMASGCVVVLPPDLAASYGAAAVSCRPHELTEFILELHKSPRRYALQQQRGFDHVNAVGSSFTERLTTLLRS